jgi:hypothetical protein
VGVCEGAVMGIILENVELPMFSRSSEDVKFDHMKGRVPWNSSTALCTPKEFPLVLQRRGAAPSELACGVVRR